jgi:alpha-L-fucosidase 2
MPVQTRIDRGVVPTRGLVSTAPGVGQNDSLITGDGKIKVGISGNPTADQISFRHERAQEPWPIGFEAPKIASALPEVKRLILAGKYKEALAFSMAAAAKDGFPGGMMNHDPSNAIVMGIGIPADGAIRNYLRTVDFESGEVKVLWEDSRGAWVRNAFVSRPDNLVVQLLTPPQGKLLNTTITVSGGGRAGGGAASGSDTDFTPQRLIVMHRYTAPNTGNKGWAGVIRVVLDGGSAAIVDGALVIKDARSVKLLSRIEWYADFQRSKVDSLVTSLNNITADYPALLAKARKAQSEVFDRASLDFAASKEERAMSTEELMADQRTRIGFNLTLLSRIFDTSRYWQMFDSGDFPPILGHLNINVNLQVAGGNEANLPEAMDSFYHWIEGIMPDSRTNAKNIYGTRGMFVTVHPDHEGGVMYHFDTGWPHDYWISSGGWAYSPFWDRYLVTGDKEFLRKDVMPGLRELALFYEDFLTEKDANGNFIFVPSYSPENHPANVEVATVINASMDIMVCKEVLTHAIEGAQILGTDADKIPVWTTMLAKMPPYLLDDEGALKEWAWPTLEESQNHRHVSHEYAVWPADEIDPDRTPELAKAEWLADTKRGQENASGHGISHRMLAAARLKDNFLVNFELKQLLEMGYISTTLLANHNPNSQPFGDQQGSILTVLMEMLVYSREGVIETLPALPETLEKGSIKGILSRSFAKIDNMSWDMNARTVDLTITSFRNQDVTFIDRHGIESIAAPAGVLTATPKPDATTCVLHLPHGNPVTIHLKIGSHKPSDWILAVAK